MDHEQKIVIAKALHAALVFKEQQVRQFLTQLGHGTGAREMALVRTHLQDAYHWAEKAWIELEKEGEAQHNDKKE